MAQSSGGKKPVVKTVVFGLLSASLYAAAFAFADPLAALFSRGALWAAAPIATVFVFSYTHGTFASNLWTCLGIEASRARTTKRPAVRPQPRATLNA